MRRAFTEVTEVTSAVEAVWAAVAVPLDAATAELARVRPLAAGLGADIEAEFRDAENALAAQRAAANADPLALWQPPGGAAGRGDGRADTSAADRLREQAAALAARIAELDRLRQQARAPDRRARGRRRGRPRRPPGRRRGLAGRRGAGQRAAAAAA